MKHVSPEMPQAASPRIVFVPGQNAKPPAEEHRLQLWRCLLEGVCRVDGKVGGWLSRRPEVFSLVPWNEVFYGTTVDIRDSMPGIEALLALPLDWQASYKAPASREHKRLMRMFTLGDWLPFLIDRVPDPQIKNTMQEALRYFENHGGLAEQVRELVRRNLLEAVAPGGPLLLIGHSLGSVLAFDTLWESSHVYGDSWKVDLLLTMGSPLGTRFVRSRRLGAGHVGVVGYPLGIRRWVNISADGDHISLNRSMEEDYRPMLEMGLLEEIVDHVRDIQNPFLDGAVWNPHRSYGYLVSPVTGGEIAAWLSSCLDRFATNPGAEASIADKSLKKPPRSI
jgi:hypothetical protein